MSAPLFSLLPDFALLSITGCDRHIFLNNQLTSDLKLIDKPSAQFSAWCNPKGRVICNFLVINTGIAYWLMFKQDLKQLVRERLAKYILQSDVKITDITEKMSIYGIVNIKNAPQHDILLPAQAGDIQSIENGILVCLPDHSDRYLLIGNQQIAADVQSKLSAMLIDNKLRWSLLDIKYGLPWLCKKTKEQFLPTMLNLDLLGAMSYQKGCYPGQEIIARLHYKGTIKKRTHLIKSKQRFMPGQIIIDGSINESAGAVINTQLGDDGYSYALAVISVDKLQDKLTSVDQPDKTISVLTLPYAGRL